MLNADLMPHGRYEVALLAGNRSMCLHATTDRYSAAMIWEHYAARLRADGIRNAQLLLFRGDVAVESIEV